MPGASPFHFIAPQFLQIHFKFIFKFIQIHSAANVFRFQSSPAINNTLSAYRPTSGTGSQNSVEIRYAVPEIFARERKRVRSAENCVVVGEVRKTTTMSLSSGMNSTCAIQIRARSDSLFLRNAPTDGHTDTHTLLLYISIIGN